MKNLSYLIILILAIMLDVIVVPTYYAAMDGKKFESQIAQIHPIPIVEDDEQVEDELDLMPIPRKQRRFMHHCDICGRDYFVLTRNACIRKLFGCVHQK